MSPVTAGGAGASRLYFYAP